MDKVIEWITTTNLRLSVFFITVFTVFVLSSALITSSCDQRRFERDKAKYDESTKVLLNQIQNTEAKSAIAEQKVSELEALIAKMGVDIKSQELQVASAQKNYDGAKATVRGLKNENKTLKDQINAAAYSTGPVGVPGDEFPGVPTVEQLCRRSAALGLPCITLPSGGDSKPKPKTEYINHD